MDANLPSSPISMVMRSHCAGDALDPPLWKVPNKALSLSESLYTSNFNILHSSTSELQTVAVVVN
jgi:hypothetical protein